MDPWDLSLITRQLPWRKNITVINFSRLLPHWNDLSSFHWRGTAVIDTCLDPWYVPPELDEIWQGRDYWVLNNESQHCRPRHVYVPLWFWQYQQHWRDHARLPVVPEREYLASSLNRFPRLHRYYTVREIMRRPWRHRSLLSLERLDWDPYNQCEIKIGRRAVDHVLWHDLAEWCAQQSLPLRDYPEPSRSDFNDHSLEHPAYWNTACNIITETSMDSSGFITEKTAKALAAGQLWCMVSGTDTVGQLRNLGFDVMDEIWQQHRYLHHEQWYSRIDAMMPVLDSVIDNVRDIWHSTQRARQHNQSWLFGSELLNRVFAPLHDRELLTRP